MDQSVKIQGAKTDSGLGSGTLFSLEDKGLLERFVGWHLPAGTQMLPLLETSKQALLLEQLYKKKKNFKSTESRTTTL